LLISSRSPGAYGCDIGKRGGANAKLLFGLCDTDEELDVDGFEFRFNPVDPAFTPFSLSFPPITVVYDISLKEGRKMKAL
jgi:hypothetical protein